MSIQQQKLRSSPDPSLEPSTASYPSLFGGCSQAHQGLFVTLYLVYLGEKGGGRRERTLITITPTRCMYVCVDLNAMRVCVSAVDVVRNRCRTCRWRVGAWIGLDWLVGWRKNWKCTKVDGTAMMVGVYLCILFLPFLLFICFIFVFFLFFFNLFVSFFSFFPSFSLFCIFRPQHQSDTFSSVGKSLWGGLH